MKEKMSGGVEGVLLLTDSEKQKMTGDILYPGWF